jgi:hypothetical protein
MSLQNSGAFPTPGNFVAVCVARIYCLCTEHAGTYENSYLAIDVQDLGAL